MVLLVSPSRKGVANLLGTRASLLVAIRGMLNFKYLPLGAALVSAVAILTACNAEAPPDFLGSTLVTHGHQKVPLSIEAWRDDGSQPCRILIEGPEVTNWVKSTGVLPRMTLAPAVVEACTGRRPYISAVSGEAEGGVAEWEESSGPDSAVPLSVYQVRVSSLTADQARIELRVLRGK